MITARVCLTEQSAISAQVIAPGGDWEKFVSVRIAFGAFSSEALINMSAHQARVMAQALTEAAQQLEEIKA